MVAINDDVTKRALAAVHALGREGEVRAAYVFGSHAKGNADRWSDIDVAAFMDDADSWDPDRKSTRLNSSHSDRSRMPSSA